ncbi:hypothetical protein CapIbe_012000 [Capra ibex]
MTGHCGLRTCVREGQPEKRKSQNLISQVECHGQLFVYGGSHLPFSCTSGKDHKIFDRGGCLKLSLKK